MTPGELQQKLFAFIKRITDEKNISLPDEMADLLDISTDSAYRRIRGEKTITIDELYTLCNHYKVSMDALMNIAKEGILFQGQYLDKNNFRFEDYLKSVLKNLVFINSHQKKCFYYLCKDLPIFHHYHFREIAAFKRFFWLKTYFAFPGYEQQKFNFSDQPDEIYETGQRMLNAYNLLPSVEIWNLESMNIFFRQIDFYREGNVFQSDADIIILYEAIEKLWNHLEEQAALGYKFNYGDPQKKSTGEFRMYFNEVLLGDNNIFVELDGTYLSYVLHTTINFMLTKDEQFTRNMYNHVQNLMKRSTLISEVSEKERSRFFRIVRDRIENRKKTLKG